MSRQNMFLQSFDEGDGSKLNSPIGLCRNSSMDSHRNSNFSGVFFPGVQGAHRVPTQTPPGLGHVEKSLCVHERIELEGQSNVLGCCQIKKGRVAIPNVSKEGARLSLHDTHLFNATVHFISDIVEIFNRC